MDEHGNEIYQQAVDDVLEERQSQRSRWSPEHDQQHDAFQWAGLIVRYLGRSADAAIVKDEELYRESLVKAAAVSLAALESFDRAKAQSRDQPQLDTDPLQRERFGDDPGAETLPG